MFCKRSLEDILAGFDKTSAELGAFIEESDKEQNRLLNRKVGLETMIHNLAATSLRAEKIKENIDAILVTD